MSKQLFLRSLLFWFLFIPVAIINGIIRNSFYQPIVGDLLGHQISSIIFSLFFFTYSYLFVKTYKGDFDKKEAIRVGALWVVLTILFEFGFGHYVAGHSWQKLIADLNIIQGRVWFLVLMVITISPLLVVKLLKDKR